MALAGELANTLVTHNSRVTRTNKYLATQLQVIWKISSLESSNSRVRIYCHSRVQTLEYEIIARPLLVCYTLDCQLRVMKSRVRVTNEGDVVFEQYCIILTATYDFTSFFTMAFLGPHTFFTTGLFRLDHNVLLV